jgi:hypothetical protein
MCEGYQTRGPHRDRRPKRDAPPGATKPGSATPSACGGGLCIQAVPGHYQPNPANQKTFMVQPVTNSCRMLVLVLSKSAIDSPHVLREVERASSKRRPVLSIAWTLANYCQISNTS